MYGENLKLIALMYQAYKCELLEASLNEARMQWIDHKAWCKSEQRAVRNKRDVAASSKIPIRQTARITIRACNTAWFFQSDVIADTVFLSEIYVYCAVSSVSHCVKMIKIMIW